VTRFVNTASDTTLTTDVHVINDRYVTGKTCLPSHCAAFT
jgi:hypothetical protein